jgi:hypothetical protein
MNKFKKIIKKIETGRVITQKERTFFRKEAHKKIMDRNRRKS